MSAKALVGILLGIILLVGVVYYSLPKSGKATLEAEVTAMNGAQSWRITTIMGNAAGDHVTRTHIAVCPDKEHIVEEGRGAASEYVRIGDDMYWRRGATEWKKGMPTNTNFLMNILTPRPCLTNPKPYGNEPDGSEELRQWIAEDVKLARIAKGEEKFENDDDCREWKVTQEGRVQLRYFKKEYVVCINEKDHLPRRMTATGEFLTRYEWNPQLTIEAPDMNSGTLTTPIVP
jgi:hypothetical protein